MHEPHGTMRPTARCDWLAAAPLWIDCARTQVLNFICDELEERTEMLHQLLPRFDTDGNGKITHAEFHKGKRHNRTARHGMARLGTPMVQHREFIVPLGAAGLGSFGTELAEDEWDEIFAYFDHEAEGYVRPMR